MPASHTRPRLRRALRAASPQHLPQTRRRRSLRSSLGWPQTAHINSILEWTADRAPRRAEPAHSRPVRGGSVLRCSGRPNHQDPVTPAHLPGRKAGNGPPPGTAVQQWTAIGGPAGCVARTAPTEGRSSVSARQRENLGAVLRHSAWPVGSDVSEVRRDNHGAKREADLLLSRKLLQPES